MTMQVMRCVSVERPLRARLNSGTITPRVGAFPSAMKVVEERDLTVPATALGEAISETRRLMCLS
jgi:predicted transcriptional regulator